MLSSRGRKVYDIRRWLSSSTYDKIPAPTWSLRELELTSSSKPVSRKEVEVLARRVLLDLPKNIEPLQQDLANMLHCLEQVKSIEGDLDELSDHDLYDAPRGLTVVPIREESDCSNHEEEKVSKSVWKEYLKPKAIKRGDHDYFGIVTRRKKKSETEEEEILEN
mmetsp:Transcript_18891/g.21645  ORF Transcript_18891/g.21645 Transcript_18891/m.21645 type:complete len:164 (-) Transcript_18891:59-550(-)